MKKLQVLNIDPPLEGASLNDGTIIVNIEYLWDMTKDEDKFIEEFAGVIAHELIHKEIRKIKYMPPKYVFGEEVVVRKMLNQSMSKKEEEFYHDQNKATNIRVRRIK